MKNGLFISSIVAGLLAATGSHAIIFPDQVVQSGHEDENPDAVSKFGKTESDSRNGASAILHPISESSFESSGGGRAPASVGNRAPAG
ncbi:MAG: hypothetical protein EBX52_13520, partial [Proteobacteria bacterium]|nr:hypothetical protein [Pseudomonadota bacterium]